MKRPPPPRAGLGSVRQDEVMPLVVFRQRTGLGAKGVAAAQRAGLRCIPFGRQKFVLGADALAFFQRLAEAEEGRLTEAEGGAL